MPIHNLIEYSKNYRKTTGSLWNYYRDEPNNPPLVGNPPVIDYNADPITNSESFKYNSSITGKISNANQENGENTDQENLKAKKNLELVVPLKHLSNFGRSLNMPQINCEVPLTVNWSENCVLTDITTQTARSANPNANPPVEARLAINAPTNVTVKITDTKLYVPVVTLSTEKNHKRLFKQLKTGFKRIIKWNRYRSEMTNQTKKKQLRLFN